VSAISSPKHSNHGYFSGCLRFPKGSEDDTFGPGLDAELSERLRGPAPERRKAIQSLISRWIEKRAELMRLDDDARLQLQVALRQMKAKGDELLEGSQKAGPGDHFRREV
jgi:hypothetical protein